MNDKETEDMADILRKILIRLRKYNLSYNYFLHYDKKMHFHFEITPRIATWAGFELSTDMIINSVLPEEAAKFYKN